MRTLGAIMAGLICYSCAAAAYAADITGAGSTFAAPLYTRWAADYQKSGGSKVIYQGTGSSDGLKQVIAREVDFAGSDAPLSDDQLTRNGLRQFPTVIGGVVPVVNLPGLKAGEVTLTGPGIAEIFLGKIQFWDDPAIVRLNPKIKMPNYPRVAAAPTGWLEPRAIIRAGVIAFVGRPPGAAATMVAHAVRWHIVGGVRFLRVAGEAGIGDVYPGRA